MGIVLTKPLIWLEKLSNQITDNAGKDLTDGIDASEDPFFHLSPKTEITDLVFGFKEMISGFASKGAAKAAKISSASVYNEFVFDVKMTSIYKGAAKVGCGRGYTSSTPPAPGEGIEMAADAGRVNLAKIDQKPPADLTANGNVKKPVYVASDLSKRASEHTAFSMFFCLFLLRSSDSRIANSLQQQVRAQHEPL